MIVTGDVHHHPPPPPRLAPTHHDIAVPTLFIGREAEIATLEAALTGNGRHVISAVRGMGGVGKTTLAREVATRLERRFPDGLLEVDMAGLANEPTRPEVAAATLIQRMDPQARLPDDAKSILAAYRTALKDKRCLVLLDNAADAEQVKPLLVAAPTALLVTSRRLIRLDGKEPILLGALPPERAKELLLAEMGSDRASDAELADLATACHSLPLALRAAGRYLAECPSEPVARYLQALADSRRRLGMLRPAEDDPELDVETILQQSLDRLATDDPALLAAFRILAVFPASFDLQSAVAVWAADEEKTAGASLDKLWRWSLIELEGARYRLHDLHRDLAGQGLAPAEREQAAERHSRHYASVLHRAGALYLEGGNKVMSGLRLFDLERVHIEAGHAWAAAGAETSDAAAKLALDYPDVGIRVLSLRLQTRTRIAWLETQLAACRKLEDRRREGAALGNLGIAWADLGEAQRAIDFYEKQLVITREIGDRRGEGNALGNLGNAWKVLGDALKATGFYEQHLAIAREVDDRRGEGSALGNLGDAWRQLGEARKAIEYYEQCLAIVRDIGDWRGQSNALGNLGLAWARLGDALKAIGFYERQLFIARAIGDRRGEGNALWNMALAWDKEAERATAIESAKASLTIRRRIEDPRTPEVEALLRKWGVHPDGV